MSKYTRSIKINYPVENAFKVFIDLNKQEMPKFDEKNPTDVTFTRVLKYIGKKKIELTTTITAYEKNRLYEVTNEMNGDKYVSRYTFDKEGSNETLITLEESQETSSLSSSLTLMLEKITAKKKLKEKLARLGEFIDGECNRRYKKDVV